METDHATNTMQDDRLGLPSASSMHRAASCPGSVALEAQCPPEPPGPDAVKGSKIHRWLSHRDVELTPKEMETALACERMMLHALDGWAKCLLPYSITKEERLWLEGRKERRFEHGMSDTVWEAVCSGQPDIVYAQGNRALVIDYKTLWGDHDPAEVNYQLRTLAVLVAENSDGEIDEVTVLMVQPNKSREIRLVTYTADDLLQGREEILGICERTRDPDAPRIPGESQCRYCRGRLRCPELKAQLTMAAEPKFHPGVLLDKDLAQLLDIASAAKHMIAAAESEAKRRLAENPDSVPGWMLKEGAKVRHVDDPENLYYELTVTGGFDHEAFMACVDVAIGKIEKAFVAHWVAKTGTTQKDAHQVFNQLAANNITLKQNAPSLKRVKELPE